MRYLPKLSGGLVVLTGLLGCSDKAPVPQYRAKAAPVVAQGRPSPTEAELAAAALEVVDVQIRTGRTRVGEAVRVHVSAWRASGGPGFTPSVELRGPATIERVGSEIVEEQDGRVHERVDFLVEPTGVGEVALTILATPPLVAAQAVPQANPQANPETLVVAAEPPERHELTLMVAEALAPAELDKLLATRAGRLERGRALARQGDYGRAIEIYNRALADERDDPVLLAELGWAAFLAGDTSLARRATREGLRHQTDPNARGALLYNLGRVAEALERDDEAITAYRRSLEVRPGSEPVQQRLDRLGQGRERPTCAEGSSCPLTAPVDAIRACELIEEEGCPLFRQRGACRCDPDGLAGLEAIGPWRLLSLTARDDAGLDQVFFLLADADADAGASDPARYHVFPPLPGSHFHGDLRGGVRSAEQTADDRLRIDFDGTIAASELPGLGGEDDQRRLHRSWTVVCDDRPSTGPSCVMSLTGFAPLDGPEFLAPLKVNSAGAWVQTVEAGVAPDPAELALEFPSAVFGPIMFGPIAP